MLQGLRTAIYFVDDVQRATNWYAQVLGFRPYFEEPFYVGFNVGGYELGLMPAADDNRPGLGGVRVYWGVPDAAAAMEQLIAAGATEHEAVQDVGEGILIGAVLDPFGNSLGVIQNPHFQLPGS